MSEDMATGFSGVTIVIFIACGVLTFFLLFLFAKREITRFSIKNRRGPHVPIGSDAPKLLRRDIDLRLGRIMEMKIEPRSLQVDKIATVPGAEERQKSTPHYYRMKALDDVKAFEEKLRENYHSPKRKTNEPLNSYLLNVVVNSTPENRRIRLIHALCDAYEQARHSPKEFGVEDYGQLESVLLELQQCLQTPAVQAKKSKNDPLNFVSHMSRRTISSSQLVTNGEVSPPSQFGLKNRLDPSC